jgi:hypothetical protein
MLERLFSKEVTKKPHVLQVELESSKSHFVKVYEVLHARSNTTYFGTLLLSQLKCHI